MLVLYDEIDYQYPIKCTVELHPLHLETNKWKYKLASVNTICSLSLWRVVRGSKLMHLELIHGLCIT
jgi:hypothetical protein